MRITGPISIPFTSGNRHNPPYGPATMKRHYRRNARPNERDIETVRVVKRRNPKSKKRRVGRRISVTAAASRLAYFRHHHNPPITPAQAAVLRTVLTNHGYAVNPRKRVVRKHKARKHRVVRKHRKVARRTVRKIKVPKGKRVGSFFKRKGKYFRVSSVKIRKGRKVIRRRVARKSSARAAKRAHK